MMPSTTEEDPFLQVQQDVLSQLQSTRSLFTSYLRIRSLAATSSSFTTTPSSSAASKKSPSPELASARADLKAALATLVEDVADLSEAVRAVEGGPARFGLDRAEVARRRRLVAEVGGEAGDMREELAREDEATLPSSSSSSSLLPSAANNHRPEAHLLPDPSSFSVPDRGDDGGEGAADYAAEFAQQQQLVLMREQDEHLDGVAATVGNLRYQADVMGRELEEQVEMLELVDGLADRVGGRLQTGVAKLRDFSRRNEDRLSSCCIAVLIFVLILLLVLLLIL